MYRFNWHKHAQTHTNIAIVTHQEQDEKAIVTHQEQDEKAATSSVPDGAQDTGKGYWRRVLVTHSW